MSADRITYCLERVSSYRDFERLCSGLLAGTDYPGIDPLGGTGDGGRDLHEEDVASFHARWQEAVLLGAA